MQNHLKNQTSPYLLQHAGNPVDWYPWCDEAFERARQEERPDIDSIYMSVCQAFTGSGGWPTTIFLTPEQKPFFAGTYFPKTAKYGQMGLQELLLGIHDVWQKDRNTLLESAEEVLSVLDRRKESGNNKAEGSREELINTAFALYKNSFDKRCGGFGSAPKFPTPHNLLFLMKYYEKNKDAHALEMVETTLLQMYRGGIFDHIGGGFSRYSTDRYYLVPHFEKMLYDNALLIMAYCKAYQLTKKQLYCDIAEKTAAYVLREMTSPEGGFYCAQDADSEGVEGKYYLFEPAEIISILGEEEAKVFNHYFDITQKGNFEGKNIPNLLQHKLAKEDLQSLEEQIQSQLCKVYEYRKKRYALHLDDKILTSWNALMIAAMCHLYRVSKKESYLRAARKAQDFIQSKLCEKDILHVSYREGKRSGKGFLDDYANEIFALLALYEATLDNNYLKEAKRFCEKVIADFYDDKQGGFFLYGSDNEQLILHPKETYDGAVPSGNSIMALNLVKLYCITGEECFGTLADSQLDFMCGEAAHYPAGYTMFLMALSDNMDLPDKVTVVGKKKDITESSGQEEERDDEKMVALSCRIPLDTVITVLEDPTEEYPLKNDKTTLYVCHGRTCKPPMNILEISSDNEFIFE